MSTKQRGFTQEDLEAKGYVKNEQGFYSKPSYPIKPDVETGHVKKVKKVAQPLKHEVPGSNYRGKKNNPYNSEISTFVINGIVPGLNGSHGLMRSHWSEIMHRKRQYIDLICEQKNKFPKRFEGSVEITYRIYKSILADWDNAVSSFKLVGDALVACRIIKDDNPKIIKRFIPEQIKCTRKEQRVEIIIKDF